VYPTWPTGMPALSWIESAKSGLGKRLAVLDHRDSALARVFGGPAYQYQRSMPAAAIRRHPLGRAEPARHADVVTAGMHDRNRRSGVAVDDDVAGKPQSRVLRDRQGVHVGAQQHGSARADPENSGDAGAADLSRHLVAEPLHTRGQLGGGLVTPEARARGYDADRGTSPLPQRRSRRSVAALVSTKPPVSALRQRGEAGPCIPRRQPIPGGICAAPAEWLRIVSRHRCGGPGPRTRRKRNGQVPERLLLSS
jgi:hypothetical protein